MADIPTFAGLSTPQLVARHQEEANVAHDRALASASVRALTLRTALREMRDVMVTLPRQLLTPAPRPAAMGALLTHNRLRGLGLLCIVLTLVGVWIA